MGLSFLAPLFLLGAIAIAVPVIVHLTQRSRADTVEFPSFMFLQRIPARTSRHRRIRDPLLLALRILAVALLAFAFARPLARGLGLGEDVVEAPRDVVVLLDRSFSMRTADRWEQAKIEARAALAGIGPRERAALVLFDETADGGAGLVEDVAPLLDLLSEAEPGDAGTAYDAAFRLAGRLLGAVEGRRREVVLITDFQRTGWEGDDEPRLPRGTRLRPVDVGGDGTGNLAVADATLRRTSAEGSPRLQVAARVLNLGPDTAETLVELAFGGRAQADTVVRLAPAAGRSVAFDAVPFPRDGARGAVVLRSAGESSDGIALDDTFRFVIEPSQAVDVLILQSPGAPRSRSLFLRQALTLSVDPPIRVTTLGASSATPEQIRSADVIVLNDVAAPGGTVGAALADHVQAGAGLVVAAGARVNARTWPQLTTDPLPGSLADVADRARGTGASLTTVDSDHPVFEVFRAPRSGDLAAGRIYRYRRMEPAPEASVIARYDDGAPAMIEGSFGDGRVLVWTTSLDRTWNDLPVQPVYLPLVQRIVLYASEFQSEPAWRRVGEELELARAVGEEADDFDRREWSVETPAGERRIVEASGAGQGSLRLDEAGYWEIDAGREDDDLRVVAVNTRVAESDLAAIPAEELLAAVSVDADSTTLAQSAATADPAARERRQAGWRYLMVAAGLILILEAALANRKTGYARRGRDVTARRLEV